MHQVGAPSVKKFLKPSLRKYVMCIRQGQLFKRTLAEMMNEKPFDRKAFEKGADLARKTRGREQARSVTPMRKNPHGEPRWKSEIIELKE